MTPLLFVVALLSATGTLVACSGSVQTNCDTPSNSTCFQSNCTQEPCSMLCGVPSLYVDRCAQKCNGSTCDTIVCTNVVQSCFQSCPGGVCSSFTCAAKHCEQDCRGGDCRAMKCEVETTTSCEQTSGKEMSCDAERCTQTCAGGNCSMSCLPRVTVCVQNCPGGGCSYLCAAKQCTIQCAGGNCTEIKPTVTGPPISPTSTGSNGARLQASIVLGLMLALVVLL